VTSCSNFVWELADVCIEQRYTDPGKHAPSICERSIAFFHMLSERNKHFRMFHQLNLALSKYCITRLVFNHSDTWVPLVPENGSLVQTFNRLSVMKRRRRSTAVSIMLGFVLHKTDLPVMKTDDRSFHLQSFDILEESLVVIIRDPSSLAHRTICIHFHVHSPTRVVEFTMDQTVLTVSDYLLKRHDVSSYHVNLCPLYNLFRLQHRLYCLQQS
jgi:hypothetical protein